LGRLFREHRRDWESNQQAITRRLLVFLEIDLDICPGNERLNHASSLTEGPAIEALLVDMSQVDQSERRSYLAVAISARRQSDILEGFPRNNSGLYQPIRQRNIWSNRTDTQQLPLSKREFHSTHSLLNYEQSGFLIRLDSL